MTEKKTAPKKFAGLSSRQVGLLRSIILAILDGVAIAQSERAKVMANLDALDSDGDGVPDAQDAAPHDATVQ